MSIRKCAQCTATTQKQKQCQRPTCRYGPYCWQHANLLQYLKVKSSDHVENELGLFALRDFKKGEKIVEYTGEILTKAEYKQRYPKNVFPVYVLDTTRNGHPMKIDARKTNSTLGRYINDCTTEPNIKNRNLTKCNARFSVSKKTDQQGVKRIFVVAGRTTKDSRKFPIKASKHKPTEILINYGPDYWRGISNKNLDQ